jgi:hypothetical protein
LPFFIAYNSNSNNFHVYIIMRTIQPLGGLCNYLRVIFSYFAYAKSTNSKLTVIWLVTPECNGKFSDYFESIPNMKIVYVVPKKVEIFYTGTRPLEIKYNYDDLKLLPDMKSIIKLRIETLENNYIAVHIRRTDHIKLAKRKNNFTDDDEFITFLDKFKSNKNIYIATDNEITYKTFQQKYSELIKFNYHVSNPSVRRHTSLKDAIIDLFMCALSSEFLGSGRSSFSDTITELRLNKEIII